MKSPDEIKKALECCFHDSAQCGECPYYPVSCDRELVRDAREYIRQLEAERDAAVEDLESYATLKCFACKYYEVELTEVPCNECKIVCEGNRDMFEWRGVQKEE